MLNEKVNSIYFVGIGGIGMSALARYFISKDYAVAGYDRVATSLTAELEMEGASIHYQDNIDLINAAFLDKERTLIVYTPAIPNTHAELNYFIDNGFGLFKRSEMLGQITHGAFTIGIAGTHGKTTTSSMVAHLLSACGIPTNAFLGGIATNFNSNFLVDKEADKVVVEADEYDRSFLTLSPNIAVVTSMDADHLDVYGKHDELRSSFQQYVDKLSENGLLIHKKGLDLNYSNILSYSISEEADYEAQNIQVVNGVYRYDVITPKGKLEAVELGMPGWHNVENSLVAIAVAQQLGAENEAIKANLKSFKGVKRRFEYHVKTDDLVYVDDYAHHPEELKACIGSVREMYPEKKITGVFQPHLFSRTKDFADEFATSLGLLDEVVLLDIYPARELPIEGITSAWLLDKIKNENKELLGKKELIASLKDRKLEVLLTLGAGDIDELVEPITKVLTNKMLSEA